MVRVEDVPEDDLEAQVTTDEFIYIYPYPGHSTVADRALGGG